MSKRRRKSRASKTASNALPPKLKTSIFRGGKKSSSISDKELWDHINTYNQLDLYNFKKAVEDCKPH